MLWSTGDESSPAVQSLYFLTHRLQEIHKKITSIGFDDCKVFIHSVDAQSSANGGIIIQVIGEMSNHGEQWRKFVQTFFLAEQPNGYFVLNDIFRFLKEETVEGDDTSEPLEPVEAEPAVLASSANAAIATEPADTVSAPDPVYEQPREATPAPPTVAEPVQTALLAEEQPKPVEPVPEPTQTPVQESQPIVALVPAAQPNGHATEEDVAAIESPAVHETSPKPAPGPPAPAPVPAPVAQPQQSAAPAPHQPVPPPQPRSWASLAATNQKKWGPVAQHEKGMSETVISSSASGSGTQTPATPQTSTPAGGSAHHGRQGQQRNELLHAAQSITTAHCFVKVRRHCSILVFFEANIYFLHKGVTENISQVQLSQTLTSRFGPIKELELVRSRACAFLEFASLDSARRAIIASLSQNQGGEGGVFLDVGGEHVRIFVETKKEKGDRPPGRPHRGGATGQQVNGGDRGGAPQGGGAFRGRSGGARGGRGGPQK